MEILPLEEIKEHYDKLQNGSKEERENIWKLIYNNNKILFNKIREELNKLLKMFLINN